ncbi:cobalt-precorrin-8 methylmutase [Suicoccus acidiformans]|uniref:Cobalt-precorrin-8 methylmutase n=1 Tax=Suicoccus acidiformans TaxID=2036206 RepID=A0A347WM20_9LACT|nr:cobalt-precorrin-8 methylmutase [Suicoccus acidiformans]AXY26127.1 cobalt-precorrin-8 methylmutase [Suicoccus acidiformans]
MTYIRKPQNITERSFEIISKEIERDFPEHQFRSKLEEDIVKRCIHTSADYDYMENLQITGEADIKIQELIQNGGTIITDTNMGLSGINKKILDKYGCRYECFVNNPETFELAEQKNMTRSMAAIEIAAQISGPKTFVIGNAPTAIYRIMEMLDEGSLQDVVALVGVPVGFVGAAESKQDLHESNIPSICGLGRKGGSNIAAAIINAIQYNLQDVIGVYTK